MTAPHPKSISRGGAGGARAEEVVSPATSSTIQLPLPPTANHMWVHAGSRHFRSGEYVNWLQECGWLLIAARFPKFPGSFGLVIELPRKMRGDIDNRAKCALDLLVRSSIVSDDRRCDRLTIFRADDVPAKQCRVTVTAIQQEKEQ